jgi:DNA repair photolyase
MKIREITAKSILNRSKIFDFCINPYTGCAIACRYCYARLFMKRFSRHPEPWGEFVDVKVNAPELLKRQMKKAKGGAVWISSVCDPYQPLEAKYRLTRRCLTVLVEHPFPVSVQTKSTLVLRDLDLLKEFQEIEVGFTIATDDETVARRFEPGASPIKDRLSALRKIHDAGVRTFVFIGPILPGKPERLIPKLHGIADRILVDRMNYMDTISGMYRKLGYEKEAADAFFDEARERLAAELQKRGMRFELLF